MAKQKQTPPNPREKKVFHEILHHERLNRVIDMFVSGKGRPSIKKFLMEEWEMNIETANSVIEEALIYMQDGVNSTKETIKVLNYNRLENVLEECDSVKEKLKTIDLINKTYGVYENNVNINAGDGTFKFDIGIDVDN